MELPEEYAMKNALEITGIGEEENEDVFIIIKKIGKGLGINVSKEMIEECNRKGKKQMTQGRPRSILVKFTNGKYKEDFMKKRRCKKILMTKDVGLPGESIIYINESLSEECQQVLNAARAIKRERGYKYLWVRNGKILLRKEDNGNVMTLSTMEQVESL